jgi:ATP-dependent DNA helicase RecQ
MNQLREYTTKRVNDIINKVLKKHQNPIFVFLGLKDLVNIKDLKNHIVDIATFNAEGNEEVFDAGNWFIRILGKLMTTNEYSIISYSQFSYITNYYSNNSTFDQRIVIIRDNLRSLLPLTQEQYIKPEEEENIERRPDKLPLYQAEQFKIKDSYYYSPQMPLNKYTIKDLYEEEKDITEQTIENPNEIIDLNNNIYALDLFVNEYILKGKVNGSYAVKIYDKRSADTTILRNLKRINFILSLFDNCLYILKLEPLQEDYIVRQETVDLLHQYWGNNATFKKIDFYKEPQKNNVLNSTSQGQIVDKIIDEFNNGIKGNNVSDIYITAPTGAGKSLLFQLPAFYASSKGYVSIIISPLIALMKDQVKAIIEDRKFDKVQYLNSELTLQDRDRVIQRCKEGQIDILYLSPELLLSYDISFFIGDRKIGLCVIDEAHLITTWGRDFRVDYWHLGFHLYKIRKFSGYKFPIVAVTATAIYGGTNDMVFDSLDSLYMQNPTLYIGKVKREDITFLINNKAEIHEGYDKKKIEQTVNFIIGINKLGLKTLVYTPFVKHIQKIQTSLVSLGYPNISMPYYGTLPADQKDLSFIKFLNNEVKILVCTKAFGMGVDIPDIQVVYHHAPSGLLPDYIQEIGRAARKQNIHGYATLNYTPQDQGYSKRLFGISSLKQAQLREVLKKIYNTYLANNNTRNMLISPEDFGYIFNEKDDLDQKVKTALMMIEKDYLAKIRYNALVARPKQLFVKVFARTNAIGLSILNREFPHMYQKLYDINDDYHIIELDLNKIWEDRFSNMSFPLLKRDFYRNNILSDQGLSLTPQIKFTYTLLTDYESASNLLSRYLNVLEDILGSLSSYFDQDSLQKEFERRIGEVENAKKFIKFILSSYSGIELSFTRIEGDAFLQKRTSTEGVKYRVFNSLYRNKFNTIKRLFSKLFENTNTQQTNRFVSADDNLSTEYIRLGCLMQLLDLGNYESRGGELPMIFVRINDPKRIMSDSQDPHYSNILLSKIYKRQKTSSEIFDYFFLRTFTNEERWNFVEDFFLGSDSNTLFEKHPGSEIQNYTDILKYLSSIKAPRYETTHRRNNINTISFPPIAKTHYYSKSLLSLGERTMKISEWVSEDPVELDKAIRLYNFTIARDLYKILISKLKANYFFYYSEVEGLDLMIEMPGYEENIMARIPYENDPVNFYKWWKTNEDKVHMTLKEKIQLFIKVNELKPTLLVKRHRAMIEK